MSPIADIKPALASLVSSGEVLHFDLVLATVPRGDAAHYSWLQFVEENKGRILYSEVNPAYSNVRVTGKQPFHLLLWVRPEDSNCVSELVEKLEDSSKQ